MTPNTVPALLLGFALIIAAYLIASTSTGRFAVVSVGTNAVVRLDTQTGAMIACQRECWSVAPPQIKYD
jgi:hypothetical protein